MAHLNEREKIQILIMVDQLPIFTIIKLVAKFAETICVQNQPRKGRPRTNEEVKLDVLLEAKENPHYFTKQQALNNSVDPFFCGEII